MVTYSWASGFSMWTSLWSHYFPYDTYLAQRASTAIDFHPIRGGGAGGRVKKHQSIYRMPGPGPFALVLLSPEHWDVWKPHRWFQHAPKFEKHGDRRYAKSIHRCGWGYLPCESWGRRIQSGLSHPWVHNPVSWGHFFILKWETSCRDSTEISYIPLTQLPLALACPTMMGHVSKLKIHIGTMLLAQWKTLFGFLQSFHERPFCCFRIQSNISYGL